MSVTTREELLRRLPAVTILLTTEPLASEAAGKPQSEVTAACRQAIDEVRALVMNKPETAEAAGPLEVGEIAKRAARILAERVRPNLRRVINATGVVLHTNLGRSLLAGAAVANVAAVAESYTNLELDLSSGERGLRYSHVEELLTRLTGAEAALVVNNNAAAVLLCLTALARGREVIVSRGQLVEIGGAFRVPDVMEQGGARLVEVGTTNKTHLGDYERAISENTALLLRVHTSNYRIIGFTESVPLADLAKLAHDRGIAVMDDVGSGALVDLERYGLPGEPTVQASIAAGADIVTFSGDKLLGGPQAGIIVGRREFIERIRRHQLNRALRIDKLTLAALEATLRLYLDDKAATMRIPTLAMMTADPDSLRDRAAALARSIRSYLSEVASVETINGFSTVGGGSLPGVELPTTLIAIKPLRMSVDNLESELRRRATPILARIQDGALLIDVRTLRDGEEGEVVRALREIVVGRQN
ncbi:MAG: L-seryl-tRNA(Sec) selenium transferase [Chloroflexota bacterium]